MEILISFFGLREYTHDAWNYLGPATYHPSKPFRDLCPMQEPEDTDPTPGGIYLRIELARRLRASAL